MDIIALLPAPVITLAVQIIKFFGMPSSAAPWVALALAVITTIIINVLGITEGTLLSVLAFLVAWLGSMGTWEAVKNLVIGRFSRGTTAA